MDVRSLKLFVIRFDFHVFDAEKIRPQHQDEQDERLVIEDRHEKRSGHGGRGHQGNLGQAVACQIVEDVGHRQVACEVKQTRQPQPDDDGYDYVSAGDIVDAQDHIIVKFDCKCLMETFPDL